MKGTGRAVTVSTAITTFMCLALGLAGCSSTNVFSTSALDLFSTSSKATSGDAGVAPDPNADVECPDIQIRSGAATLMIGSKPGEGEPSALDLRYQVTIVRTARECRVTAGVMTMKVGIEGRVITGPAGGPGTVDVPLRLAVVQEGVNPKTVLSRFAREQVTIVEGTNRATFTHIDPEISFPMPQPAANIDAYVVYVGFDPLGAQQEKRKPASKPKPRVAPKPRQS
ncbi:MAG TPA: hypothetical protein VFL53_10970 [Pseudolabrys sp.]|nr:hypothetical protein [Pseudolabrys sp.]